MVKNFKRKAVLYFALPALTAAVVIFTQCGSNKVPQLGEDPVRKVIAAMTLEEKAYLVVGAGMTVSGSAEAAGMPAGTGATATGEGYPAGGSTGRPGMAPGTMPSGQQDRQGGMTQGQQPSAGTRQQYGGQQGQPQGQQAYPQGQQGAPSQEQIQQMRQQYGGQRTMQRQPGDTTGMQGAPSQEQMQQMRQQNGGQRPPMQGQPGDTTGMQGAPSQEQMQQMRQQYGGQRPPMQGQPGDTTGMQGAPTQQQMQQPQPQNGGQRTMQRQPGDTSGMQGGPNQQQMQQQYGGQRPAMQGQPGAATEGQPARQYQGQNGEQRPAAQGQPGAATEGQPARQYPRQGGAMPSGEGTVQGQPQSGQQGAGQRMTGAGQQGTGTRQMPQGAMPQGQQGVTQGFTPGQNLQGAGAQTGSDTIRRPESVVADSLIRVPGAAGSTYAIPRLGIPSVVLADGPEGLRISSKRDDGQSTYYCTAFPVSSLLASTWDTDMLYKVGEAMGNEALEYGVDILLAPAMDIQRNPLGGRNFEYYSEDPLVSGKLAAAFVKGVESQGVGTAVRQFAANNTETNRMALNTIVSERALREIYLEGFRIAVQEAHPWTVMSSGNLINGVYASESEDLLTKVLRDDWGYGGFVLTDFIEGSNPVAQVKAGNDMLMPGNESQAKAIIAAVRNGTLDEKILDRNVEKILNIILQTPSFKKYTPSRKPDLQAHATVARQAAADGIVMLKNDNGALPFAGIKTVALFGRTSYNFISGGTGNSDVNESHSVSLVEGLQNGGYTIDRSLQDLYTSFISSAANQRAAGSFMRMPGNVPPVTEMKVPASAISESAKESDIALITIGRVSSAGTDRTNTAGDFILSADEIGLIRSVTAAFRSAGKKTVVILNTGGVLETASWKNIPDAIVLAGLGGQEAGNSVTDILSGKVNPSAKLAVTFPLNYNDLPSAATFPGKVVESDSALTAASQSFPMRSMESEITYNDGIYVGYRFYETFGYLSSYEFGYGLSYTNFSYENLKLSSKVFEKNITLNLDIRNTGNIAGREVVQLYLSAPDIMLEKPERELRGFAKTALLQPGESQTVVFEITPEMLASFNTAQSAWFAESGTYDVRIGASSRDIRVEDSFELENDLVVKKVNKALSPVKMVGELSIR